MKLKNFFYYLFGHFIKGSKEYENQLIVRFIVIWLSLILISLSLYFITKNIGYLLLWLALFAIFSRYTDFHKEVKNNLDMIISSNRLAYLIYILAKGGIILLIILSFLVIILN